MSDGTKKLSDEEAQAVVGGEGIGGSRDSGSNITISGGTVAAGGGNSGIGIGGGSQEEGSNITISGGTVAAGGNSGAGIGIC